MKIGLTSIEQLRGEAHKYRAKCMWVKTIDYWFPALGPLIIRIHHECEVRIEKSVPCDHVCQHSALMTKGCFFSIPPVMNNRLFFFLTTGSIPARREKNFGVRTRFL